MLNVNETQAALQELCSKDHLKLAKFWLNLELFDQK